MSLHGITKCTDCNKVIERCKCINHDKINLGLCDACKKIREENKKVNDFTEALNFVNTGSTPSLTMIEAIKRYPEQALENMKNGSRIKNELVDYIGELNNAKCSDGVFISEVMDKLEQIIKPEGK